MGSETYKRVQYKSPLQSKSVAKTKKRDTLIDQADENIKSLDDEYERWIDDRVNTLKQHSDELVKGQNPDTNLQAIAELAHEIRGTSSSYGQSLTSQAARSLYMLAKDEGLRGRETAAGPVCQLFCHTLSKLRHLDKMSEKVPAGAVDALLGGLEAATQKVLKR